MLMVARTSYTYIFFDAEIRSVGIIKYTGERSGQWVLCEYSYICLYRFWSEVVRSNNKNIKKTNSIFVKRIKLVLFDSIFLKTFKITQ